MAKERVADFSLEGKVAVVTGGSRGLGLAMAQALAEHGASVVIAGRDEATLRKAAESFDAPARVAHRVLDVGRPDSIAALDAWVAETFGRVDVLVNNAGISPAAPRSEDTADDYWDEIIAVNLTGVFHCCRAFGRRMLAQGSGSIVNVSSVSGIVGIQRGAAYCASKGGVENLTRALALDWAHRGVRVNSIAPGTFETDITAAMRSDPKVDGWLRAKVPMRRHGLPHELGGAVVFLASSLSSYMTGQHVVVDGGWLAA